jgi:predicted RNA-binding Zn ribbon-like protein
MRLDGGHPALELVNTIYASAALEPIDYDVLVAPGDLSVFAARVGLAPAGARSSARALRAARALRSALDPVFRALAAGADPPRDSLSELERFARRALIPATLAPTTNSSEHFGVAEAPKAVAAGTQATAGSGRFVAWSWPGNDPMAPVHRLALAAVDLLADAGELARLHRCDACCWLYLDHSRGRGRRWCSMADCGGEAKKRRYVEKRRARRTN